MEEARGGSGQISKRSNCDLLVSVLALSVIHAILFSSLEFEFRLFSWIKSFSLGANNRLTFRTTCFHASLLSHSTLAHTTLAHSALIHAALHPWCLRHVWSHNVHALGRLGWLLVHGEIFGRLVLSLATYWHWRRVSSILTTLRRWRVLTTLATHWGRILLTRRSGTILRWRGSCLGGFGNVSWR